jgi:hypothetical protein
MRVLIAIAAVVVVTTACSDSDGVDRTTVSSSTTAAATAPTTTLAPPATTTAESTTTTPPATSTATATSAATTTTMPLPELLGVELELVAELPAAPLVITAPAGDTRLYVGRRDGVVVVVDESGEVRDEPFVDLTDVVRSNGIEQGLLGIAFHPGYTDNGRFFVYYTDANDDAVLAELTADPAAARADRAGEREVLFLDEPTDRHNAGALEFGPDGYLYVAVGDGGDGGHNGQKSDTLFGTILRIDVDSGDPYAVPGDNPFVEGGGAPEVWAYGLRNPWRFAIDDPTGLMYIGDVGQQDREEVDVVGLDEPGANFGWAYLEGTLCFSAPECREVPTTPPVVEYDHTEGCSITGGVVYRGPAIPELDGTYFYGDWCQGWVRSFRYVDGAVTDERDWPELDVGQLNTFGTDGAGELYLGTWEGQVWKLVPLRAG